METLNREPPSKRKEKPDGQDRKPKLALCKATAVRVAAGPLPAGAAVNQLAGRVARLSRGTLRDEVVLTLRGQLQLVGFADHPHRLRAGSKVTACLEENAVVLALV